MASESKTYAERLFNFPDIGALSENDTAKAIKEPANESGVAIEEAGLQEIFHQTKGYPYFLQEWGYHVWNLATKSPISVQVVKSSMKTITQSLDLNFFRVRYDRLTPSEKAFLRAMAELGEGPYRVADIANLLKAKVTSLSPLRTKLIKKGMIYSPAYGDLAFTVPLFDKFMIRAIPEF